MTASDADRWMLWAPRVLAVLTALFIGSFALDALDARGGVWAALPRFMMHLAPAILLLITVALAWHRAWIGALVFLTLAAIYTGATLRRPDWILVIAGPLALVGVLYLLSWLWPRAWPRTG